jgi:hypothetical protein
MSHEEYFDLDETTILSCNMGTNSPVMQHHISEEYVIKYFKIIHCPYIFASFLFTKIETKIELILAAAESW